MNTTPDDMSERILKRLAKRLLRCPFDEELFDSKEGLCEHLLAHHSTDICRKQRMPKQEALGDIDRPSKLTFCGHCLGNMVPHALGRNALSEIDRHIREAHPNPNGPAVITMTFSSDPALIDRFIEDQVSPEVCVCSEPGCGELFNSEPNVAAHWADRHCYPPTIEGVRRLLETDPERFGALLEECLKAEHDEVRSRLRQQPVADGSLIRRYPNVPRIRSRPSEYIVYVEGERATVRQEDFDEMLATEGMDAENDAPSNEPWTPHTVHLELRFCNIEGGFVPLVGELKSILRRLPDGGTIEVSWQNDPEFFHCIVSKSERAIYSSDGKLKRAFEGLPSGVVLYITSVAPLRYEFRLKAKLHTVRDCKVFVSLGENRWRVETQNLELQWETGEGVFRHQSTFDEMDALHQEARQTGLSVRDAVYEFMRENAKDKAVKIKGVYEFVFWWMRTCSRAAVWSQFRKEHECYVPAGRGFYRFDESKPLPMVRVVHTVTSDPRQRAERVMTGNRAPNTGISILIRWSAIPNQPRRDDQVIQFRDVGKTQAYFLASLFRAFGLEHEVSRRLMRLRMNRDSRLSRNRADFVTQDGRTRYPSKQVPGTELYLCTHGSTPERADTIYRIVRELGFRPDSVEVRVEQAPTLRELLDTF